jgi:hypothetical protein
MAVAVPQFSLEKRVASVVWTTITDEVWVTDQYTKTVWVDPATVVSATATSSASKTHKHHNIGHASSSSSIASTSSTSSTVVPVVVAPTTSSTLAVVVPSSTSSTLSSSSSTSAAAGQFFATSPLPEVVSTTSSSSSVYVAPAPTTTSSSSVYVAPSSTVSAVSVASSSAAATSSGGSSSGGSGTYSGDLTHYDAGLGACGLTSLGTDPVVALPYAKMGTKSSGDDPNPYCGKMITVYYKGVSAQAKVVDKCMGCVGDSIDLSDAVFSALIPGSDPSDPSSTTDPGRVQGSWSFDDGTVFGSLDAS